MRNQKHVSSIFHDGTTQEPVSPWFIFGVIVLTIIAGFVL